MCINNSKKRHFKKRVMKMKKAHSINYENLSWRSVFRGEIMINHSAIPTL